MEITAVLDYIKRGSGSYLIDNSGLSIGDSSVSPTLLTQAVVARRGPTTINLYEFSNTPTGALSFKDGSGVGVYYQDSGGAWKRDNFTPDGLFQTTDSLTLSELRNDEAVYDLDLDGNGKVGDTIDSVLANDGQGKGIFKTTSGSYIIDDSTLSVGDQTNDPTILTQAVAARRGPATIGLKEFSNTPTGLISYAEGGVGVFYQDTRGNWFKDDFNNDGLYQKTNNYNLSQVLNDEAVYDLDLDGDGKVGDTISAVYMDVPDADTGVENPKDNFGLYKTASGSYIADTAGLAVGDQTNEPTLLVKQTVFRGQTSTSLYDFIYTPTGAVTYAEGDGSVYYKDSRDNWFRDNFSKDGVFQTTDSLTLSELRNEEAVHDLDLDGNGKVGDTIDSVLANDGQGKGIFKTTSGSYIIDDSTLSVGDQTNDPTILTQAVVAVVVQRQ